METPKRAPIIERDFRRRVSVITSKPAEISVSTCGLNEQTSTLTAAFGGLATPPRLCRAHIISSDAARRKTYLHVQRPGREEEGVPALLCADLRELFELEEFANGHAPQAAVLLSVRESPTGSCAYLRMVCVIAMSAWDGRVSRRTKTNLVHVRSTSRSRPALGGDVSTFLNYTLGVPTSRQGISEAIAAKWLFLQ